MWSAREIDWLSTREVQHSLHLNNSFSPLFRPHRVCSAHIRHTSHLVAACWSWAFDRAKGKSEEALSPVYQSAPLVLYLHGGALSLEEAIRSVWAKRQQQTSRGSSSQPPMQASPEIRVKSG